MPEVQDQVADEFLVSSQKSLDFTRDNKDTYYLMRRRHRHNNWCLKIKVIHYEVDEVCGRNLRIVGPSDPSESIFKILMERNKPCLKPRHW